MVALATHHAPLSPAEARLLDALCRPDASFAQIAHDHGVTVPDLTLWMARPDIAHQLHALESACATRARLIAAAYLPQAAVALGRIVHGFNHGAGSPRAPGHESARRASSLLLRIANFTPGPRPRRAAGTPRVHQPDRDITVSPISDPPDPALPPPPDPAPHDLAARVACPQPCAGMTRPEPPPPPGPVPDPSPSASTTADHHAPDPFSEADSSTSDETASSPRCPVPHPLMPSSASTTAAPVHPEHSLDHHMPDPRHEPFDHAQPARPP